MTTTKKPTPRRRRAPRPPAPARFAPMSAFPKRSEKAALPRCACEAPLRCWKPFDFAVLVPGQGTIHTWVCAHCHRVVFMHVPETP